MKLPLEFNVPVVVLGGGEVADAAFDVVRTLTHCLVAADGGADAALGRGVYPDAVIGDLDSLSGHARTLIPPERIVEIAEQDSTDFDKALRSVTAPLILAVGFTGGRIDHELAAFHVLTRYFDRAVIVVGAQDLVVHTPARLSFDLAPGTRLSLFPLATVRVQADGLRWPEGRFDIAFDPLRKIGTSNEVVGPKVEIRTDAPGLLTILPLCTLSAVIAGLQDAVLHSPAA